MRISPSKYNFLRSLLEPKVEELRAAWKAATTEEEKMKLEDEYITAYQTADLLEQLYFEQ